MMKQCKIILTITSILNDLPRTYNSSKLYFLNLHDVLQHKMEEHNLWHVSYPKFYDVYDISVSAYSQSLSVVKTVHLPFKRVPQTAYQFDRMLKIRCSWSCGNTYYYSEGVLTGACHVFKKWNSIPQLWATILQLQFCNFKYITGLIFIHFCCKSRTQKIRKYFFIPLNM